MGWIDVAPVTELKEGDARLVDAGGVNIAVFNINGEYHALKDACSHDGSPLIGSGLALDELFDGDQIKCPRHGARFCARTGEALTPPAYEPLVRFPVRVQNGMVQTRGDHRY